MQYSSSSSSSPSWWLREDGATKLKHTCMRVTVCIYVRNASRIITGVSLQAQRTCRCLVVVIVVSLGRINRALQRTTGSAVLHDFISYPVLVMCYLCSGAAVMMTAVSSHCSGPCFITTYALRHLTQQSQDADPRLPNSFDEDVSWQHR